MSFEDDYRASIAWAHKEDRDSRARRRKLRNEYQDALNEARISKTRGCFLNDICFHVTRLSTAEEGVMLTLRQTAGCWSEVCERAITRQLDIESAKKHKQVRDIALLEHTRQREVEAQLSVEKSDQARLEALSARYAARMLADRNGAVWVALEDVMERTAQCLTGLETNYLSHSSTQLLKAFSVDATLWQRSSAEDIAVSAVKEAFHHILHGSPYAQSSPEFLALLELCYEQQRSRPPLAQVLRSCSVPIFVLDGPKYGGKSLLASFLKSKYHILCISDESLVQRALQAASSDATEKEEDVRDWATLGRCVEETLLDGRAVEAQLMTELLSVQLTELQDAREALPYDAVLLEGVFRTVDAYKTIAQRLSSEPVHPHQMVAQRWGLSRAAEGGSDAVAPMEAATEELPPLLRLSDSLAIEQEVPVKQESKTRTIKKVDLASLPPVELPEVEDTQPSQEAERAFVKRAEQELASLPTGISGVLHISCSPEEVFRRFAGLRTDCETGKRYHLIYNPPPQERLPYMVPLGRPDASSVELYESFFHQMERWSAIRRWLTRQSESPPFAPIYELAGDRTAEEVQQEALQTVSQIISDFQISQQLLHERDASVARLSELQTAFESQTAAREAERLRLAELYTEKGAPLPPALQATVRPSCLPTATLSASAANVMLEALAHFTDLYEADYAGVWRGTTQLVQMFLHYYTQVESQMMLYWRRPDDKQAILHRFQESFDSLPASLRVLPTCKAELHLSLDALGDALHRCIALRDAEANGLLDLFTSRASFVGGWQALVCQEFARLLQAEVDRYVFAFHMFSFFLGAVTGEPLMFDDVEADMPRLSANSPNRLTQSVSAIADLSLGSAMNIKSAKEKRAATSKRGHRAVEEQNEKIAEDQLVELMQGVLNGFSTITDKLKAAVEMHGKTAKRVGGGTGGGATMTTNNLAAPPHVLVVATSKCYALMEAERAAASSRVALMYSCWQQLLREADTHAKKMRTRMEASLSEMMAREAVAANTAVYVLRECVEAEKKSPAMHLGCTTFAVLPERATGVSHNAETTSDARGPTMVTQSRTRSTNEERRSFITDVPLCAQLIDPQLTLHPGLTAVRLLELVQHFRCVAPDYQLSRFDFLLLVTDQDYTEAAAIGLDAAHMVVKTREELFDTFDPQHTGFVDWREVVVHLLFWVTPVSAAATPAVVTAQRGAREFLLQDLLDTRASLGVCGLTEEQFLKVPRFIDRYLDSALAEAYTRILWSTFHDPTNQVIQPHTLLGFLCADAQPIRGFQKAFYIFSAPGAEGRVSFDEMDALCHLKATNARLMGQADPCRKMNLRLLFDTALKCTFEDVCASPIGRKMLNQADLFHRRQFVKRK
ncbi:hypothetical protein JKF63_00968 [Porcisia hertigi]|uniref:EF-hand domain-containing protein n=1 Tax=Porcisia hertigi TaxID=2761500 RepID=A0A836HCM8_9TRYP|nr:hypothetical protein JKF63_00968 [Porcisia hertigi]